MHPPREDRRPLRRPRWRPGAPEVLGKTSIMSMRRECLGEDVGKLISSVDLQELEMPELDRLMREMLPEICLARSRPPMTLLAHSMQAVLSS